VSKVEGDGPSTCRPPAELPAGARVVWEARRTRSHLLVPWPSGMPPGLSTITRHEWPALPYIINAATVQRCRVDPRARPKERRRSLIPDPWPPRHGATMQPCRLVRLWRACPPLAGPIGPAHAEVSSDIMKTNFSAARGSGRQAALACPRRGQSPGRGVPYHRRALFAAATTRLDKARFWARLIVYLHTAPTCMPLRRSA
jgi:hypothetical protein